MYAYFRTGSKMADMDSCDEGDADNVEPGRRLRGGSARKRRDSYDYTAAAQQLGMLWMINNDDILNIW